MEKEPPPAAPIATQQVSKDELRTYYATKAEVAELRGDLGKDLADLRADLKTDIHSSFRNAVVIMLTAIIAATAVISAIVTLTE